MAKNDMTDLSMPDKSGVLIVGGSAPMGDDSKPHYPSLWCRLADKIDLPDGDFFFLGIGHKVEESEKEEDDGTKCYSYEIEVHAIQPIESVQDEKAALPDKDLIEKNFDDAADHMQSLKENAGSEEESDDDEDDDYGEDY